MRVWAVGGTRLLRKGRLRSATIPIQTGDLEAQIADRGAVAVASSTLINCILEKNLKKQREHVCVLTSSSKGAGEMLTATVITVIGIMVR